MWSFDSTAVGTTITVLPQSRLLLCQRQRLPLLRSRAHTLLLNSTHKLPEKVRSRGIFNAGHVFANKMLQLTVALFALHYR